MNTKEGYIEYIYGKLCRNEQLRPNDINAIGKTETLESLNPWLTENPNMNLRPEYFPGYRYDPKYIERLFPERPNTPANPMVVKCYDNRLLYEYYKLDTKTTRDLLKKQFNLSNKENEKMTNNRYVFKFMIHDNVVTFVDPWGEVATVKLMKGDTWSSKLAFFMAYLKNHKGYSKYDLYKLLKTQTTKPAKLPAALKALRPYDDHHVLDIEEIKKPAKGKMVIVILDPTTGKYTITEKKCKR